MRVFRIMLASLILGICIKTNELVNEDQFFLCINKIVQNNSGLRTFMISFTLSKVHVNMIDRSLEVDFPVASTDLVIGEIQNAYTIVYVIEAESFMIRSKIELTPVYNEKSKFCIIFLRRQEDEELLDELSNHFLTLMQFVDIDNARYLLIMPFTLTKIMLKNISQVALKYKAHDFVILTLSSDDGKEKLLDLYTYIPFQSNGNLFEDNVPVLINQWSSGGFLENNNIYPPKVPKSFFGREIKVSAVVNNPFTWLEKNYTNEEGKLTYIVTGPEIEILNIICKKLNLTITFLEPHLKTNAIMGKVHNAVLEAMYGESDVSIGTMTTMAWHFYKDMFVRSRMYTTLTEKWFVPCPIQLPREVNLSRLYFVAFSSAMAIIMAFIFIVFTSIIHALAKKTNYTITEIPAYMSISRCFLNIWAVHLGTGTEKQPRSNALKILFLVSMCYAYVMNDLLRAYFKSFLIDPGMEKAVTTFEDLRNTKYYYGYQKHLTYHYMRQINFDSESESARRDDCEDTTDCLKRIVESRNYATITCAPHVEYFTRVYYPKKTNVICALKDGYIQHHISLFFTLGSPYVKRFDHYLQFIVESGLMIYFEDMDKYSYVYRHNTEDFHYTNTNEDSENTNEETSKTSGEAFNLEDVMVAFVSLLLGLTVGSLSFIWEMYTYRMVKSKIPDISTENNCMINTIIVSTTEPDPNK
ncbi:Ionotropic receptor 218 [Blattella germanica]|nr:Ionotropic receptor 218 [Blattella germanica]